GRRRFAGSTLVLEHAGVILWGALALGLAAVVLLPQARFDFDPMNLKDPSTESVSTLFDLMNDSRTSPYSITVLAKNLDEARDLAAKLARLEQVKETITLYDYVPTGQDEKLDIIGIMGLFLSPALASRQQIPAPTMEEIKSSLEVLGVKLRLLAASAKGEGAAAKRLLNALRAAPDFADLENRLLSSLPRRLLMLKQSLEAEPISIETLPESLRKRHVAADGRARVEVYPKENMKDREALARFVGAVRKLAPQASGSPVVIFEAGKVVVAAVGDAAVLAVVMISVLLAVILKSFKDVVLVFMPLLLAVLLTIATSVLLGLSFNYANVIVLPLLFGLGVASGIHLVLRRRNEGATAGVFGTSTPRAVVFSGLTTIGSFGTIALSGHPGTSSMGLLLAISITLTLGCTLVVLPALMVFWRGATEQEAS
ncbi:MAG TPA: MMPL family transporter, partial [Rhodospirillaceae bacterium]|nr:MMPL family transporter [Rhodospirillaceae bacterium]